MKGVFREITALSVISGMLSCVPAEVYADSVIPYNTGMTRIFIRSDREDEYNTDGETNVNDNIQYIEDNKEKTWLQLEPGTYLISGAKQMRIAGADNEVLLFKGKLSSNETVRTVLPAGGTLEYTGKIYLTAVNEKELEDNKVNDASAMSPFIYSPVKAVSFMKFMPGGCVEINSGIVKVYNKQGELKYETYVSYEADKTGYILGEGIGSDDRTEQEAFGETFKLNEGQKYVVGTDFNAGAYTAKGSGTVRVYDYEGYIKTVIKLKQAEIPGSNGVESYKFRFDLNDSVITEGNIEITETIEKAQ
ncbi:MAG: hypothetical protein Q4G33_08175 [bacterium]|nr:hypothetical protein [bacterium]